MGWISIEAVNSWIKAHNGLYCWIDCSLLYDLTTAARQRIAFVCNYRVLTVRQSGSYGKCGESHKMKCVCWLLCWRGTWLMNLCNRNDVKWRNISNREELCHRCGAQLLWLRVYFNCFVSFTTAFHCHAWFKVEFLFGTYINFQSNFTCYFPFFSISLLNHN